MVWVAIAVNIGIALLSAGVMYAMRDRTPPPPDEPPPFDPDAQIPMITESEVIPVVFGTCMIASPNVVHLGAYGRDEETLYLAGDGTGNAMARNGLPKRRYRLDMIFAVCAGPVDAIVRVDVDAKPLLGPENLDRVGSGVAFDLSTVGVGAQVSVAEPYFFGEDSFPWGSTGFLYEVGTDDGLAGRIYACAGGLSDNLIPAENHGYPTAELGDLRGLLTVSLRGLPAGDPDDFLERSGGPFYHGTTPRLRPWRFLVERIMRRGYDDAQWYTAAARIDASVAGGTGTCYDMNPAHIIHEVLTDRAWGLGLDASVIDDASFTAAADLFAAEVAGMSLLWNRESEHADIIREVERTTDSTVYFDERDGVWRIRPVRADWVLADLPVLDSSNVVDILNFAVPSTDDLPTTVSVIYWDREEMRERVYTVHDQAAIASRGGRQIVETLRYPGVMTRGHIRTIAHRDLRTLSRARTTVELEAQPSAAEDLRRGDAFRLTWDEWSVDAVYRVVEIDLGTVVDPTVTITAVEDVFTDRESFYDEPGDGQGATEVGAPQDCAPIVAEIPYWMWRRTQFEPVPLDAWIADPDPGVWRNRAIVWAARPVDGSGAPLWEHSDYRVAEQIWEPDTVSNVGQIGTTGRARFANRCEITAEIVRDPASSVDVVEGVTYGDHAVPVTLEHDSPYWSPRVGDVIRVEASSPTTSPVITLADAGPPARNYDFSHLDAGSHEFLVVVRVVSSTSVLVLRGCFDTVVHETIPAQTALVVGWVSVSDYGLWDVSNLGLPWYSIDPYGWTGNHGIGVTRSFDPLAGSTLSADSVSVDLRALTRTPAGEQSWSDAASNVITLSERDGTTGSSAPLHRAIRPLVPGAIRVIDDTDNARLYVPCEPRNRLADWMIPAGVFADQAEAAPPEALDWEVDPDTYAECWVYDGEVDPPELLEILLYDSVEGGFVWSNADEQAAYLAKNGSSALFSDLWLCVLTNNRSDVAITKARPSYQFARFHLERPAEFGTTVTHMWTDTTLLDLESTVIQAAGEDIIAGRADWVNPSAVKRATADDAGLTALWTYVNANYQAAIRCGDYHEATDRVALGGAWNTGKTTRVVDAATGTQLWEAYNYGHGTPVTCAVVFDETGRLWTFKNSTGVHASIHDTDGTLLATRTVSVIADTVGYNAAALVGDGSGDVITASATQIRRLTYSGGSISVVWSVVPSGTSTPMEWLVAGGTRPMRVINGQLVHWNRGTAAIELRNVTTGALEGSVAVTRAYVANVISDIHVDIYGDIYVLMCRSASSVTDWDLFRFSSDWTLKSSRQDDAANPMYTAFTGVPVMPASVFVTPTGRFLMSGYAYPGSPGSFLLVGGKLE